MAMYIDDTTEIEAKLLDAKTSHYQILLNDDRKLRVPLHVVHKIQRLPGGSHTLKISSWYLRRMGVIPIDGIFPGIY